MALQPAPVKTTVRNFMRDRLRAIAGGADYTYDIKRRVYLTDRIDENVECPSVSMVERTSKIERDTNQGWHWTVLFNVGFIFESTGENPDERLDLFEQDVWKALGYEHQIDAFTYASSTVPQSNPGVITFSPVGTARNVSEAMEGRVHGQLDVHAEFVTDWYDFRRI